MKVTKRYVRDERPTWMETSSMLFSYVVLANMPDENIYSIKFQSDGVVEVEMDEDTEEEVESKEVEG